MIAKDKYGFNIDTPAILYMENWLDVLATPCRYRVLTRPVEPEHLARLLDIWIAYTERGDNYLSSKPERHCGAERTELARKLRALILAWKPPDLPAEITEAAHAVLEAEGAVTPRASAEWEQLTLDFSGRTLESFLAWPETEIMLKEADPAPGGEPMAVTKDRK